jgi:hypothetical protein
MGKTNNLIVLPASKSKSPKQDSKLIEIILLDLICLNLNKHTKFKTMNANIKFVREMLKYLIFRKHNSN